MAGVVAIKRHGGGEQVAVQAGQAGIHVGGDFQTIDIEVSVDGTVAEDRREAAAREVADGDPAVPGRIGHIQIE